MNDTETARSKPRACMTNWPRGGIDDNGWYWRGDQPRHQWACPCCGTEQSYRYMSCRLCTHVRRGVSV